VVELVVVQTPGPVEEVVDEGVDGNHLGLDPFNRVKRAPNFFPCNLYKLG
jgi:hypothetical protein